MFFSPHLVSLVASGLADLRREMYPLFNPWRFCSILKQVAKQVDAKERNFEMTTLPETSLALEMDDWKITFLLGRPVFRG